MYTGPSNQPPGTPPKVRSDSGFGDALTWFTGALILMWAGFVLVGPERGRGSRTAGRVRVRLDPDRCGRADVGSRPSCAWRSPPTSTAWARASSSG